MDNVHEPLHWGVLQGHHHLWCRPQIPALAGAEPFEYVLYGARLLQHPNVPCQLHSRLQILNCKQAIPQVTMRKEMLT